LTDALVGRLTLALATRYAIERELGQGGMATVYLARDLRHDRKVALKVLRPELAAVIGAERFLQEIRVTANLQHPHILPLHDSGEADGFLYYVMPYVEGESLRDRLNRELHLPVDEAVRAVTQVAAALHYAHGRGVIHRDIKPENILLTSGAAVVADFGIARAVTEAGGGRLTETGISLGTPQYMSPEQATADRELDGRSDVYALGCVLYEMLAGEPPFAGPTAQSVIAKVLTETPRPVRVARPAAPRHVEAAIHTALAKLPADRFRTAAEFAVALTAPVATTASDVTAGPRVATRPRRPGWRWALASVGVLIVAIVVALSGRLRPAREGPRPVVRVTLELPTEAQLQDREGPPIALSPDGTVLVYSGRQQLFMRRLDQIEPIPLPNTQGAEQPFFSPDGQHIGFFAGGSLKRVPLAGGPAVTLAGVQQLWGATWGSREVIVFASGGDLFRVSGAGGAVERVQLSDTTTARIYRWPEFLPDGKRLLVTLAGGRAVHTVGLVDLESGAVTRVAGAGEPSTHPHFVEPDWLVCLGGEGTIFAVPFDWRAGRVTGPAQPVLESVRSGIWGDAKLGLSRGGWAVYLQGSVTQRQLTLVDRRGNARVFATDSRPFSDPRFSPDAREVAVTILAPGRGLVGDIWLLDLQQATLSRLTFDRLQQFPEWSADGRQVVFTRWITGVAAAPAGGGPIETLYESRNVFEAALTHDGRTIVYRENGVPGELYYVRRDSLDRPHALFVTPFDERAPAVAPDDRWLAYVSNESGRDEVYVRPFPEGGGRWQVSVAGGAEPRWRADGSELFYRNADTLFAVQVRTRPEFAAGQRTPLFTGNYVVGPRHANYDVSSDGQRFVFVTGGREYAPSLILVQNLLSTLAPAR
jgi:serine/threonine-protein kinase